MNEVQTVVFRLAGLNGLPDGTLQVDGLGGNFVAKTPDVCFWFPDHAAGTYGIGMRNGMAVCRHCSRLGIFTFELEKN